MHAIYKLRDWLPIEKLSWNTLSLNPNAINLLEANPDTHQLVNYILFLLIALTTLVLINSYQ